MKHYKVFQICCTVNFILSLFLLALLGYRVIQHLTFDLSVVSICSIGMLILSCFAFFDWFCYQLLLSIRSESPFDEALQKKGSILKNICLVLSLLLAFLMVSFIMDKMFEVQPGFFNVRRYYLAYCALLVIATTFYLCIAYQAMVKHHTIDLSDTIESLGSGE